MPKLGSTLFRYFTLGSTNDAARELASSGAAEGVAVLALEQTAGRGRQGRSWSSPAREGLYISIIIRPRIIPSRSAVITLAVAVAVAETLRAEFGIAADIKWPNDVMVAGRKVCGVLVESAIEGDLLRYAVVGIGVNLGQRRFSLDIGQAATSLALETGREISPDDILSPLLEKLDHWYRTAIASPSVVLQRWEALSSYARGCEVRVTSSEGSVEGVTRGLTASGSLLVELDDCQIREIISGEVSLRCR